MIKDSEENNDEKKVIYKILQYNDGEKSIVFQKFQQLPKDIVGNLHSFVFETF